MRYITLFLLYLGFSSGLFARVDCNITELVVEPLACENGLFYVHVDFNVTEPAGDLFGVMGNGTNYGSFPYDSLPITLGPLEGDGVTEWEFVVFDVNNPDCQAVFILGTVNCCAITDVVVDPTECTNLEVFNAIVNFNHTGTGGVGFDVFNANGGFLGFFQYENLPVTVTGIPSVGTGITHITICDNDNPDCCATVEFESLDCNPNNCEIYNVDVFAGDCENGQFFVTLTFNYENVSDHFVVLGNGNNYGTFDYDSLPVTIGPLEGNGVTVYEFVVHDAENNDCSAFAVIDPVSCPQGCGFNEVSIDPIECQGEGFYIVGLNFNPVETGNDGFSVYTQGVFLGSFAYDDLPVFVDSFPASCALFDVLTICDNADSTCCETYEFEALSCCEDCLIFDLVADAFECDSTETFALYIDFEWTGNDEVFDVFKGNVLIGTVLGANLPDTLYGLTDDGGGALIRVCAHEHPDCCAQIEISVPECGVACEIFDVHVDTGECTGDSTFSVAITYEYTGFINEFVDLWTGNIYLGFFHVSVQPIVINDFPWNGHEFMPLTICENDNPECCRTIEFEVPGCLFGGQCAIFDLVADAFECDSTETFALYIDFEWTGNDEVFEVFKGNVLIGTVLGANLPDTLYGLTDNGGGALIRVCAQEHPDCCAQIEIAVPACGFCDINGFVAEAFNCDTVTGTYDLAINFTWEGNAETFDVFLNNVLIGTIAGADLPYTFHGLEDNGGVVHVRVCANDNPDCCATVEIVPGCVEACSITELVADAFECDSTETFALYIDFEWTGNDEVFEVFKGNVLIGTVLGAHLPDTLYGLTDNGGGALIRVCAQEHPDCCAQIEISVPDCGAVCEIFDVHVDTGECTGDSTFSVAITYEYTGFTNEFVDLWTGNIYLGFFHVSVQPIVINDFPWNGHEFMPLTICENDNPECCRTIEFEVPGCLFEGQCGIFELVVDPIGCVTDSTFAAWVSYVPVGFDGPVQIWAGDTYLGLFPPFIPLLVPNIPEHNGGILLEVCMAENQDCCAHVEFQGLVCENICSIDNLTATVSDCEAGTFNVTLNFDFDNEGSGFIVAGNGTLYGSFSYNQVPLTLGPFEADSITQWEFVVVDLENPLCLDFVDVGIVDCTTGIFSGPSKTLPLDVFYGDGGAHFMIPDGATAFSIWAYDGRQIGAAENLSGGDRVQVNKYISVPGLYFVQVRAGKKIYIGKVVVF